jgi:hypothetical protein
MLPECASEPRGELRRKQMREHPVLTKVKRRLKDMELKLCDESCNTFKELEECEKMRAQVETLLWVKALFEEEM